MDLVKDGERVSLIVPVYNVEDYLPRAVESLLGQTYEKIDIILVDDGSEDASGRICDAYAQKYPNVRTFHTRNLGQSHARNLGVLEAKTEWIMFLDADDVYLPDAVACLMAVQRQEESDAVFAGLAWLKSQQAFNEKAGSLNLGKIESLHVTTSRDTAYVLGELYYKKYSGISPVAKLYRREVLLLHPFPEGKIHEDTDTTYKLVAGSPLISLVDTTIYYYIHRSDSTTGRFYPAMEYLYDALDHNVEYVWRTYGDNMELKKAIVYLYIINGMQMAFYMLREGLYKEAEVHRKRMMSFRRLFILNGRANYKQKIWYLLYMISPRLFMFGRSVKKLPNQ